MKRLWYKDHTYMDVEDRYVWEYEADPEWDHTEDLGKSKDELERDRKNGNDADNV